MNNWTSVTHHTDNHTAPAAPDAPIAVNGPTADTSPVTNADVIIGDPPGNVAGAPANNGVPWANMNRYDDFYVKWDHVARTAESLQEYLDRYVLGVKDRAEYMKLQPELLRLQAKSQICEGVNYGY